MKRKIIALLLVLVIALTAAACGGGDTTPAATEEPTTEATPTPDATATPEEDDDPADDGGDDDLTFAIITKSAGIPFMERMAYGFENAAAAMGFNAIVQHPVDTTAEAQITVINNLVAQGVDGIAVASNDPYALESALQAARDQGIVVVTLDSDTAGSQLFVNQAGVFEVAQVLVDSVYDMTGGAGQFAVLSATSVATNQNAWIAAMEEIIAQNDQYAELEWLTTVFGDDEAQRSFDETQSLLVNHPGLDVIVAPTTVGIMAAAQVVLQQDSDVLVAGLGLPSDMLGLVGDDLPTPYMYLWNPIELGEVAAYALAAFANGDTDGSVGDTFTSITGTTFTIIAAAPEVGIVNAQIIVGLPFRFDGDNIEEWAQVY
ncbi:MAG: substrate-binding domain-containing protein [Oscillospiraceae bacterium]|nr:substrate-binding domain-containing protein [Oscillospiraceae bacterium]